MVKLNRILQDMLDTVEEMTKLNSTDSRIEGKGFKKCKNTTWRHHLCVNNPKQGSIESYENLPVNVI